MTTRRRFPWELARWFPLALTLHGFRTRTFRGRELRLPRLGRGRSPRRIVTFQTRMFLWARPGQLPAGRQVSERGMLRATAAAGAPSAAGHTHVHTCTHARMHTCTRKGSRGGSGGAGVTGSFVQPGLGKMALGPGDPGQGGGLGKDTGHRQGHRPLGQERGRPCSRPVSRPGGLWPVQPTQLSAAVAQLTAPRSPAHQLPLLCNYLPPRPS